VNRLVGILISAASLYVAVWFVTGLDFDFAPEGAWLRFALVALIFGLVNGYVRPILRILTLPITILTMGLFLLVLNALLLLFLGWISSELSLGLVVADFGAALLGALVISVVGTVLALIAGIGRKAL
jgi:putative membrane protein